jgi:1-acyl-sn-glycerol-3-phosphate acyltransferase
LIPENMPTFSSQFGRAIGRGILRIFGWRVTGILPNEPKIVLVVAPHTSNWDFIMSVGALLAMGLKVSAMMKKEAFIWPLKGLYLKLGFLPTDRRAAGGVVGQMHRMYDQNEKLWVGITPEGTRSKVDRWKTGFLRIAADANVPILIVGIDGRKKQFVLDKVVIATDDFDTQAEELRQYMWEKFEGINPENQ